jgi:hypothetical protein
MDAAQFEQLKLIVKASVLEANQELAVEVAGINGRLDNGDARMGRIEADLKTSVDSTKDMRDMFDTAKKGLALMGSLGTVIKWLVGIAAPIAALWAAFHGKPAKP